MSERGRGRGKAGWRNSGQTRLESMRSRWSRGVGLVAIDSNSTNTRDREREREKKEGRKRERRQDNKEKSQTERLYVHLTFVQDSHRKVRVT